MIRLIPGLIAAVVAYLVLPFLSWFDFISRFLLFLFIYAGVALVVDQALKRYGN